MTETEIRGIKHKISTTHKGGEKPDRTYRDLIKQTILISLRYEGVDVPCAVNVMITGDKGICKYNVDFRGVNEPTDVLSFPMQVFKTPGWKNRGEMELDPDTGVLPLGDIIISTDRLKKQAKKYGHTFERETTHLIIHSVLHLLGYSHSTQDEERLMRPLEKKIMNEMGYLE